MFKRKYASQEFELSNLPRNRYKQFFDIFKNEWLTYLGLGFFLLISAIPFILVFYFKNYTLGNIYNELIASKASNSVITSTLVTNSSIFDLMETLAIILIGIVLGGISRISRELAWGEGILFFHDFVVGIKKSFKVNLFDSFFLGVLLLIVDLIKIYSTYTIGGMGGTLLIGVSIGIFILLFVPLLLFMMAYNIYYSSTIRSNISVSFKLLLSNYLKIIPFSIFISLIYFIFLINVPVLLIVLFAVILLFIVPLFSLAWTLMSLSIFDTTFNIKQYPHIYKKGLYIEEKQK